MKEFDLFFEEIDDMMQTMYEYGPGIDLLYDICYNEQSIKCGDQDNCKHCRIGQYMQFLKDHDIFEQTPNEEKQNNEYNERWIFEIPKEKETK